MSRRNEKRQAGCFVSTGSPGIGRASTHSYFHDIRAAKEATIRHGPVRGDDSGSGEIGHCTAATKAAADRTAVTAAPTCNFYGYLLFAGRETVAARHPPRTRLASSRSVVCGRSSARTCAHQSALGTWRASQHYRCQTDDNDWLPRLAPVTPDTVNETALPPPFRTFLDILIRKTWRND